MKRLGAKKPDSPVGYLVVAAPVFSVFHRATFPLVYECQSCHQISKRPNRAAQIVTLAFFLLIIALFVYALIDVTITLNKR